LVDSWARRSEDEIGQRRLVRHAAETKRTRFAMLGIWREKIAED
jgi:hypothetical protein